MRPATGKRALDVVASGALLAVLSPVFAAIAVAIRATMGRPVLFAQLRPGLDGRLFRIYKFRTMTDRRGPDGEPLPDGERLTPFGRWLRRKSLDELPELLNVLKGDMSLVGPRPLLSRYLPYYSATERRRHAVRPGITGWAQIHGRNEAGWDERLARDVWYVDHMSLGLDLKILARTVFAVLRGAGVVTDPRSAMQNLDEERRPSLDGSGDAGTHP